jgi:hypothetical protein
MMDIELAIFRGLIRNHFDFIFTLIHEGDGQWLSKKALRIVFEINHRPCVSTRVGAHGGRSPSVDLDKREDGMLAQIGDGLHVVEGGATHEGHAVAACDRAWVHNLKGVKLEKQGLQQEKRYWLRSRCLQSV